jgi:hypothetical protein
MAVPSLALCYSYRDCRTGRGSAVGHDCRRRRCARLAEGRSPCFRLAARADSAGYSQSSPEGRDFPQICLREPDLRWHRLADPGGTRGVGADITWNPHNLMCRNRRAFVITETELKVMAALAKIGLSNMPKKGYSTPAATGTPTAL